MEAFRQPKSRERRDCTASRTRADRRPARVNRLFSQPNTGAHSDFQTLPPQQFQVLFNSLFKVLFIFPSRYLFAIGLPQIFSFRRTLPPGWRCSPKQHDSRVGAQAKVRSDVTGLLPSTARYHNTELHRAHQQGPHPGYNPPAEGGRFSN